MLVSRSMTTGMWMHLTRCTKICIFSLFMHVCMCVESVVQCISVSQNPGISAHVCLSWVCVHICV